MSETPSERKRRLRFLTVAELVGIAALAIAALGYWDSHRERTLTERERTAEERAQARAGALKQIFLMTGAPQSGGDSLRLASVHPEQVIQTQAVSFPHEIRGDTVQTTGNPRIEAGWIEGGLTKAEHVRDDKRHHGRVPVGIATTFIEDGQTRTDSALYQLGYSSHPRMLRSDKVELEGLSLVRRGVTGDLQAAADALWTRQNPPPPAKP
ncbi:MAG TPA: hypothetical protein VFE18_15960 [Phenylobacterium sp.]|uniref:hypothetical protein n=1 Tax=Phenylobacterium sp. TaxID=1871053 RepID=UPI002D39629D|nr:hypothetical protein [Phenylobacterium sp.]HZZ69667.1 hypothetical protein [Phenylobacterium sp.]